ncbi:MAG: GAF domain-containing sensor histidine kinase [Pelobium sp.]
MSKKNNAVNEAERLASLLSYNILDTADEADFDEIAVLASAICQTPIALISLVDGNRQWFKSNIGLPVKETPISQSFCAHAIASSEEIMQINDATQDDRFANNPLVTGQPNIVFYAGVPLITEDGHALGTLCVIDYSKRNLDEEQTKALKVLAKQVVNKLELRKRFLELEKTNESLLESNILINKFASMAAHDIKNPLTSILLTSQLLKKRMVPEGNQESIKLIDMNLEATKNLLELLNDMLHYSKSPASLLIEKQDVGLLHILKKVAKMLVIPENIEIKFPAKDALLIVSHVALEQILMNLMSNAIRYNDKNEGLIEIDFKEDADCYILNIKDNGIGIATENFENIFKNNFIIQEYDRYNNKSSGIGLYTVKELVKALNGEIKVSSQLGLGTTFSVFLKK